MYTYCLSGAHLSMHIDEFVTLMESVAPPELAEEYDEGRIGLIVKGRSDIENICCALDATPAVVGRAVEAGADALVVHHTPIWHPITRIDAGLGRLLGPVLSHQLNVYVLHSNFDRAEGGINDALADLLGLKNIKRMSLGVVGACTRSLAAMIGELGIGARVWGPVRDPALLAVVGGSGFDPDLIEEAVALGADAFLSAELKHSVARNARIPLIEATHYALEAPGMQQLGSRMGWEFIDDPPEMNMVQ
jgi:dinuclear metal center YbgI/SA1388 family protein